MLILYTLHHLLSPAAEYKAENKDMCDVKQSDEYTFYFS